MTLILSVALLLTSVCLLADFFVIRDLRKDLIILRKQRDTSYEFLRTAENYSHTLEREQYEIRRIVNARNGERTSDAVKNWTNSRRAWS